MDFRDRFEFFRGASLAATKFKFEDALEQMGGDNPQTRVALENVIPVIQGTIDEARRIQMSLRPSMLDDLGGPADHQLVRGSTWRRHILGRALPRDRGLTA